MDEAKKVLEVNGLKTSFFTDEGVVKAVDGVSFTLREKETVGIVGESGSGKSVTSLSLMRLIPNPPGKIVDGQVTYYTAENKTVDLLNIPEDEMRRYRGNELAMIFQEPMTSLNPVFTCGNQVEEAILIHQNIDKQTAKSETLELFRQVQLPDPERVYKSYPHQLSGGQKQRVMIAMALSNKPRILIADEPTTALDVTIQKQILELMADLKEQINATVIFITHDLGVVAEIADRVIVMYQGKIVEEGTIQQIFNDPKHPYTKGLLACRPPLNHRLTRLPVVADFLDKETAPDPKKYLVSNSDRKNRQDQLQAQAPILEVNNLSCWYPKDKNLFGVVKSHVKAVDDVSFKVYPGETLGLVGESGCGKTTLGRCLLRLIKARSGEVIYQGNDILRLRDKEMKAMRRKMQIIFQDPYSSLNPRMTIGQAIFEPIWVHGVHKDKVACRKRTEALLERVGLEARFYNRYPHEFSGGQRQRICIARALALEPEFIVCDESVSALDVSVQAQVLNLLMELREQYKLTYIFISHDLSVVKLMSDRMMVMKQGQIEEIGDADQIYHHPKSAYTQKLIDAIPRGIIS